MADNTICLDGILNNSEVVDGISEALNYAAKSHCPEIVEEQRNIIKSQLDAVLDNLTKMYMEIANIH